MSEVATAPLELRVERLIPAPPERVFELWTDPKLLARWFGPEGYTVPKHAMDVRPGGAWHTTLLAPDGTVRNVGGVYRAIEKPKRLVLTWGWVDAAGTRGHETEITVTFAPAPGGTRLVLCQREFESANARDLHGIGWNSTFNKLERFGA